MKYIPLSLAALVSLYLIFVGDELTAIYFVLVFIAAELALLSFYIKESSK